MQRLTIKTVDVFTDQPFLGNPVAVVFDADSLSDRQMQRIANWTNLSETTFVLPATAATAAAAAGAAPADYRVRIFTPSAELPFAGHPTIGTAHALLEAGRIAPRGGKLVQECGAGLVELHVDERDIAFTLPVPTIVPLDGASTAALHAILGTRLDDTVRPCLVDVGPRWIVVQLPDAAAVLACSPDLERMKQQDAAAGHTGVVIFGKHPPGAAAAVEVRAFAPAHGVAEDPVCGSGNGCVAAYLRHTGQAGTAGADLLATQGGAVGRAGRIRLAIGTDDIRIGGTAVTCVEGTLVVPLEPA